MESFVLTRSDAVMRSASSAALFADTKGRGADRWRRRSVAPGRTRRAAAQMERRSAALVLEAGGATRGRCCCRPAELPEAGMELGRSGTEEA